MLPSMAAQIVLSIQKLKNNTLAKILQSSNTVPKHNCVFLRARHWLFYSQTWSPGAIFFL